MQGWEKHIISCFFNPFSTGDALSFTLKAFLELMEHGIVSWDVLEHKFIKTVRTPSDNFLPDCRGQFWPSGIVIAFVFVCMSVCV